MSQLAADSYADTRSCETCTHLGLRRSERQTKGTDLLIFAIAQRARPSMNQINMKYTLNNNIFDT